MQDQLLEMLLRKDEISWQSLLLELVKTEQMDPWDIDISLLTNKYIQLLKKMKELDLHISGKVLLAAAILLRIKSNKLVAEDVTLFDNLLTSYPMEEEDVIFDEDYIYQQEVDTKEEKQKPFLIPRTPQERRRKVSIYELIDALQKALEVSRRRTLRETKVEIEIPKKKYDITELVSNVYSRIKNFFLKNKKERLTFSMLVPSEKKEDKIFTFIPLIHLASFEKRKIDLIQEKPFTDFEIKLLEKDINKEITKELSKELEKRKKNE